MNYRAAKHLGTVALVAQVLVFGACSSSGPATTTGTGGMTGAGTGGSTATGTGGSGPVAPMYQNACLSGVKDKGVCASDPQCFNTCGPLHAGYKNCDCATTGAWTCPVCAYPAAGSMDSNGNVISYSCYKLPATPVICPPNAANAMMLPKSGDPCTLPTCQACGSSTAFSYLDSSSIPKMGYCVCSASDGTGVLSCASAKEWPPQ